MTDQPTRPEDEMTIEETVEASAAENAAAAEPATEAADTTDWKDRSFRLAAEMENLRRRTQKEVQDARNFALTSFAKDLLNVADNMERALEAINKVESAEVTEATKTLKEGVAMVSHQLGTTFSKFGINKIKSVGEPLNPDHHQVMMEIPSSEHKAGHIAQEMQPGYTLNGRLLRPALVGVATAEKKEA